MKKISGLCSRLAVCALLMALLGACGNKATTTVTSSTSPSPNYIHSVAFRNTTSFTWGSNTYGQLGNSDPNLALQSLPQILSINSVAGISAGGTHTLAFKSDGTCWAWGNNGFGQLGVNSTSATSTPAQISLLTGTTTAVAAGGSHSLALQSNGTVMAWGDNQFGQLGNSFGPLPVTPSLVPIQVLYQVSGSSLALVTKIAAGGDHSLAIAGPTPNGTAYSWGNNQYGQLGHQPIHGFANFSTSTNGLRAAEVTNTDGSILSNVTDIAAGGGYSLFLKGDGTVWACGGNSLGQLGVGDTANRNRGVVQVSLTGAFSQVAAGAAHSLALRPSDGTVWAWGYNFSGQLGNGQFSSTPVTTPSQVLTSPGNPLPNIVKIVAIGSNSFAVDSSGQLWAWGDNIFGELGIGTSGYGTSSSFAIKVSGFASKANLYHP